jgi:hypothetical protein
MGGDIAVLVEFIEDKFFVCFIYINDLLATGRSIIDIKMRIKNNVYNICVCIYIYIFEEGRKKKKKEEKKKKKKKKKNIIT